MATLIKMHIGLNLERVHIEATRGSSRMFQ